MAFYTHLLLSSIFAILNKRAQVCILILLISNMILQLACGTRNRIQSFPVRFKNRA